MDAAIPFAGREYFVFLAVLAFARGMDFLSTWVATPRLVLEGNPIAKWLGWKWGGLVNLGIVGTLSLWPLLAIIVSTASLLVAARNFQSAWLMRTLGEVAYRDWYLQQQRAARLPLYLFCLAGNALLPLVVGAALVRFSEANGYVLIIPMGIGLGIMAYALAVLLFTLMGLWRGRRRPPRDASVTRDGPP